MRRRPIEPYKERLMRRRIIDLELGCWLWEGPVMANGYGVFSGRFNGKKGLRLVHRIAASIFLGFDLNSKLMVCHRCDVRKCFNPDHLFVGTQLDNIRDMWAKGRGPDQRHPKKLNECAVRLIRSTYAAGGETTRSLAKNLGLGKSTVEAIINHRIWKHVGN